MTTDTTTTTTTTTTGATTFTVTIENVSTPETLPTPDGSVPVPLSPGAYAAHTSDVQLFETGEAASTGIERIAEDGMAGPLAGSLSGVEGVLDGGAFTTPDGADGAEPLTPGNTYSFTVSAEPDDDPRLSLATMFIQSNDLFYAPSPEGVALFDGDEPVSGSITDRLNLWDAGTEVNERPGVGPNQAPRQSGADTGVDEGTVRPVTDGYDYPATADVIRLTTSVAETDGEAITWNVTIQNVSTPETLSTPDGSVPVPLSPGAYAAHTDAVQLFETGEAASTGIERIAEDGMAGPLAGSLSGVEGVLDGGAFTTPDGADGPGPLTPGNTYSFQVTAAAGDDPRLSLATMFIQSNDLFYAPADAAGVPLFEGGEPVEGDLTGRLALWDAGTERNERPGVGPNQAPRQSSADTGPPEGVVRVVDDGYDYPAPGDVIDVRLSPQ
jgi:Spondin_N.